MTARWTGGHFLEPKILMWEKKSQKSGLEPWFALPNLAY
jgi:hypothetical protein